MGASSLVSELKALLAHPDVKAEIDLDGLAEVFGVGPSRQPGSGVFHHVHELRPGHALTFKARGTKDLALLECEK